MYVAHADTFMIAVCGMCYSSVCMWERGMWEIFIKWMNRNVGLKTRWGEEEKEALKEEQKAEMEGWERGSDEKTKCEGLTDG